tara:strand:+ start:110 stop:754 length:645 start_codon:yes stop_codon:yes gene_type:complete
MKLFLDSANTQDILDRYKSGLIAGITTNPTLIKRSGRNPHEVYNKLADNGVLDISMEVVGDTEEELYSNAIGHSKEYEKHATIKLPCSMAGIRVCKRLSVLSIRTNITLVFNASQAILAALAGATYVSPFVGRMDDNSLDGLHLISEISHIFKQNNVETQILAASIRDVQSVGRAFAAGADICTIPTKVFDNMADHVLTDKGIAQFNKDASDFN